MAYALPNVARTKNLINGPVRFDQGIIGENLGGKLGKLMKLNRLIAFLALLLAGLSGCRWSVGLVSDDGYSWSWINSNCTYLRSYYRYSSWGERRRVREYRCYDGIVRSVQDPDSYHRSGRNRWDRDEERDERRNDYVRVEPPRNDNDTGRNPDWPGSGGGRRSDPDPVNRNRPEPPPSEPPRSEPPPRSPEPNDPLPPAEENDPLPPGESRGTRATAQMQREEKFEPQVSAEAAKMASQSPHFDSRVFDFADKYEMSFRAASRALTALKRASHPHHDYKMLYGLGLKKAEIEAFKSGQSISLETIERVAVNLDKMKPENLLRMFEDLQADYLQRLATAKAQKK